MLTILLWHQPSLDKLGDAGEYILVVGTDLTITSSNEINLTADTQHLLLQIKWPTCYHKEYRSDTNGARLRFVKDKGANGGKDYVVWRVYATMQVKPVLFAKISAQAAVHTNDQEGGKLSWGATQVVNSKTV